MTQYVDPVSLRQALIQYYNEGELRTMCFDLGIDYESIGGRGKSEKAAELILFARRNNRVNDIAAYIRQTRPHAKLKMLDAPPPPPDAAEGGASPVTNVYNVKGDMVGGDKVEGDKVRGDKTTTTSGDTFNMSGDFRGANLNIKSSLTNVNQTIGALPTADDAAKAELQKLVAQLNEMLQQVPAKNAEEATAVAEMAEEFIETANSENPNKVKMKITGEGLKMAAENLAAIVPDVVKIAGAIVTGILGLG